jgi:hypothetical protein
MAAPIPMMVAAVPWTLPIRVPPVKVATPALAPADPRWSQWEVLVLTAAWFRLSSTLDDLSDSSFIQPCFSLSSLSVSWSLQIFLSWS